MTNDSGRRRPSISAIVAVLALVVAVSGTAIAAPGAFEKLDKKEQKQVKKIAKREANKRINARAGNLSVANADNADTAALANAIGPNSVNAGSIGTLTEREESVNVPNNSGAALSANCQAGEQMITGGTDTSGVGTAAGWAVIRSGPDTNGWSAAARNQTGNPATLIVEVVCLAP